MILSLKETAIIETQDESCSNGKNQLTHQQMSLGADVFKVGGSDQGSVHLGNKTNKVNGSKLKISY